MKRRSEGLNRRRVIAGFLAAGLAQFPMALLAQSGSGGIDRRTFAAFVDVLLPRDAHSPAASEVGTDAEVIAIAAEIEMFQRLIALACDWLNGLGVAPFHALPEAEKLRIVAWMSGADYNQIPGRFYHLTRQSAVQVYYARADTIAGFDLNPAPQPEGYPPPWL